MRHRCFGLVVESDLDLPGLRAEPAGAPPDVVIRPAALPAPPPDADRPVPGLWLSGDRIGLDIPEVARYEARAARELLVDRSAGADENEVRLFLLGTMMGAILTQRGRLVLHGNAFASGAGCAVAVGHSGAGKSTLAARLERRGVPVLSDDVVPVDEDGRAAPGYPRIKLWADALGDLGVSTAELARVHSIHPKFELPLSRHPDTPLTIHTVYELARHDGPLTLQPVGGIDAFAVLAAHSYRPELLRGADARAHHLRQCSGLAAGVRVVRVLRPPDVTADRTADAVLDDLAAHAPAAARRETA